MSAPTVCCRMRVLLVTVCMAASVLLLAPAAPVFGQATDPQPRPDGKMLLEVTYASGAGGFVPAYGEAGMKFEVADGIAQVSILEPDLLLSAIYSDARYGEMAAEIDVRAVAPKADGDIGMVLRGNATTSPSRFYAATIDPVLAIAIFSLWQDESGWNYLAEAEIPDGILAPKGFNRLRVEAAGNEFTMFLNGTFVLRTQDDTLPGAGFIGLAVSSTNDLAEGDAAIGEFDNLRIYALEEPPPSSGDSTGSEEPAATGDAAAAATGLIAEVTAASLNVRSGPVASYPRLGSVKQGNELAVLGRNEGCTWLEVETPFGPGWVSAGYVRLNDACSTAPVTNQPSAPATQEATAAVTATPAPKDTVLADFENFGAWRRGDEAWGDFVRSSDEVFRGVYAGALTYDFPADAPGGRNYVVFRRAIPIAGKPSALEMQVYGDGSGNFLNVWVQDAKQELWQFSFGQIDHTGWETMRAPLDPSLEWPVQPIDGESTELSYPLQFYALLLDYPSEEAAAGVIYTDDLRAVE